jgi:hypothetical protein
MMTRLIYQRSFVSTKPIALNLLFEQSELALEVKTDSRRDSWKYAATVSRFIGHPDNPTFLESWELGFDKKLIYLPKLRIPYQLSINPAKWLGNYTLTIWESLMGIYTDPATAATANSVVTSTVAATNAAAGAVILAANPNRKSFTINNTSTSILYLGYGAVPTAIDYVVALPAKSFFDPNINFAGEIKGLWTNTNGNAVVKEFT